MSGPLVRGSDGGGLRYFLDGRPVHAGTGLELLLPEGTWVRVRFEVGGGDVVQLFLALGGPWESWIPPLGRREGEADEVPCNDCAGRGCLDCDGTGKRWREIVRPEPDAAILTDARHNFGRAILRWPPRSS